MSSDKPVKSCVLVVDDDASQRQLLADCLQQQDCEVLTAASGQDALVLLGEQPVAMMISDVRMPGISGLELLRRAREQHPALPVLLVTAYADIRNAVEAMRDGALNYLEKPIDLDELQVLVRETLGRPQPAAAATAGRTELDLPEDVIAESPAMRDVFREAALVAPFNSRVLITGESGTGKEIVAKLIHTWSTRHNRPMLHVNCAAIPELLLESELFGHEKGAFTGATELRIGRFEEAHGGTLFLDEIGEMPQALQVKILRVTQDGTYQRLGSNREYHTDVRLIAATNRNLEAEVAAGRFREDLFYRLTVIEIHLPPLRERTADILPLANFFAARHTQGKHRLSPAVATSLTLYPWPGNVRELHNAMERAVLMARGGVILPEHLPRRIIEAVGTPLPAAPAETGGRLQDIEDLVIIQTLREHQFNRTETAKALGISRRALIYKLRRLEEAGYAIS